MVARMLALTLGVFAIWLLWQIAQVFWTADSWLWWAILIVAGVSYQCAFRNPSFWWMGVGIGGAAAFLGLLTDLIIVASDAARVHVLRSSRNT
jgi:hypothetical protein